MPYITREDGERFVIPSYRDVITSKSGAALKKEIVSLSESYGEYITLQRRTRSIYDVAFSPDTGYLLGESIWHHFKQPMDMIFCEAVPNTTEAILVIVKDGGVYLDGRFSVDAIPEELIIFLTQKAHFEIYVYGDVPISEIPMQGKFSFDANAVKSFKTLDAPVFNTLPLLKAYQFQLVEPTLKRLGIGGIQASQVIGALMLGGLVWFGWSYFTAKPVETGPTEPQVNPYQGFYDAFQSPSPDKEIEGTVQALSTLVSIPGWSVTSASYGNGVLTAKMSSAGTSIESLTQWAEENHDSVSVTNSGVEMTVNIVTMQRPAPEKIYPIQDSLVLILDRLSKVYPGNSFALAESTNSGVYTTQSASIAFSNIGMSVLSLIGQQLKNLPFVLKGVTLTVNSDGSVTGSINLQLLGS